MLPSNDKEKALIDFIRRYESALVAFSGGLDSSLVLWASLKALGGEKVWAATSHSPSLPRHEAEEAARIALEVGLGRERHLIVATDEIQNSRYLQNDSERCYFCKNELHKVLTGMAREMKIAVVFDGANISDLGDYRPGHKAARELGVVSPLIEAGLTKEEIRSLAGRYGLSFAQKPAAACLASRIPYGISITPDILRKVEQAETAVRKLGLEGFRVRYHGPVARLELRAEDIPKVIQNGLKDRLVSGIKAAGFKYVALDLEGYRTGSLNETMEREGNNDR